MEQIAKYFPTISENTLQNICRKYSIRSLALFGSILHGDDRADSDLDLLVEFESGYIPGFLFVQIQDELSQLFGRTVDLHTRNSLSSYFRDAMVKESTQVYGRLFI